MLNKVPLPCSCRDLVTAAMAWVGAEPAGAGETAQSAASSAAAVQIHLTCVVLPEQTSCGAQAAEALSLLQWLGEELGQLPQAQQREALRLPLLLGGKLSSRVVARGLRSFLLPSQSAAAVSPSVPSQAMDEPIAPSRSPVSRVQSPRCCSRLRFSQK